MALQSPFGPGPLAVIQQPLLEARSRLDYDLQHILSLDQIQAIRCSNEYSEGPAVVRRPPAPRPGPRAQGKRERTREVIPINNNNNNYERRRAGDVVPASVAPQGGPRAPGLSRSTSTGSAASSGSGGSGGSGSSERGLLARSPQRVQPVRTQPEASPPPPRGPPAPPPEAPLKAGHRFICERCGKCKCGECTAPRSVPSCLACEGQCLCSLDNALEQGTCMCLVKGVFYHCSHDDEGDSCADHPCSLSRSHCGSRFLCMGLLSLLLPCLLCYPPARGCVHAAHACYDRARRPGCRCANSNTVYCKLERWGPAPPGKPC